jgi:signal transduction histidine kinase
MPRCTTWEGESVAVLREGPAAWVVVQDEGLGIPGEALPHVFERFYRAGNIHPERISGVGIGLYVVEEVVRLHGGRVMVESQEGQGSTFRVYLPCGAS